MVQMEHATYARIAQSSRGEMTALLNAVGADNDNVSESQLRDTLTWKVEGGEILLPE